MTFQFIFTKAKKKKKKRQHIKQGSNDGQNLILKFDGRAL